MEGRHVRRARFGSSRRSHAEGPGKEWNCSTPPGKEWNRSVLPGKEWNRVAAPGKEWNRSVPLVQDTNRVDVHDTLHDRAEFHIS